MEIKSITVQDAGELLAIYAPYVERTAVSFEYKVPSEEEFRSRIAEISSRYPYLKAVENGRILGYAYADCFKARAAYDWSVETTIYLRGDARRKGTGRALYEALEKNLQDMGILNMNACIASPVKESRYLTDDSYHFHTKMGFQLVGRFHKSGYKFGEWYDMIWMEKMIGNHSIPARDVIFATPF